MFILRCFYFLWFIPSSFIAVLRVRSQTFEVRYALIAKYAKKLLRVFRVTLETSQAEELPTDCPILFISNHQSEFDMLIQIASIQTPYTFISKIENENMPYIGSISKTLEVIFFDREDRSSSIHMLRESARRLKKKDNLLIYPEGTRSKGVAMNTMQAGSIQPAYMAKATIVPMVLVNSYDYKKVMMKQGTFQMKLLKPIAYESYKSLKAEELIVQLQQTMQQEIDKKS
ncbi:MAG: lysophospholipid acyltransferase family protein [Longicatena sp.]